MVISQRGSRKFLRLAAAASLLLLLAMLWSPTRSFGAKLLSEDEEEILIKTTLMTFNDANLTGNYSVLHAKSSRQLQDQVSVEKLTAAFQKFRDMRLNIESVVSDDIVLTESKTNSDGVLELVGMFKDDDKKIKYDLKFVKNDGIWRLLGINVNYKDK
jgi:hypothetical protein